MSETNNGKTIATIAYLTLIGWIIALIMHNGNKTELGAFHIRQMLGLLILSFLLNIVANFAGMAMVSYAVWIICLVLWVLGFIGALQGEKKLIPLLGSQFQDWFKGIIK